MLDAAIDEPPTPGTDAPSEDAGGAVDGGSDLDAFSPVGPLTITSRDVPMTPIGSVRCGTFRR